MMATKNKEEGLIPQVLATMLPLRVPFWNSGFLSHGHFGGTYEVQTCFGPSREVSHAHLVS